jgi:hypothetical protein
MANGWAFVRTINHRALNTRATPTSPERALSNRTSRATGVSLGTTSAAKEIAMPTGASPKREREYKEIESKFKKEGRYPGREEEVAARIVNKQRAEHGETKSKSSKAK